MYRAAIEYVGWAYRFCEERKGHRNAKDQLLHASQAIPLNIAEGNGAMRFTRNRENIGRTGSTPIPIPTPMGTAEGRDANQRAGVTRSSSRLTLGVLGDNVADGKRILVQMNNVAGRPPHTGDRKLRRDVLRVFHTLRWM